MKRTEPESVGELLRRFFDERAMRNASAEGRAVELWRDVVGDYAAAATEDVYIRAGVIYVTFSSASARADVMMRRNFLLTELNSRLGGRVVRAIVLK